MRALMVHWLGRFNALFDSSRLFWWMLGGFSLSAVYIALTGAYSMAFDEYVHFGSIQLYTQQWSPFFGQSPPSADAFGAIARDPSYLYHYLMSFPYRVFAHFCHAFTAQIIFLRLCDVAFFVGGILAFRAAFRTAGFRNRTITIVLGCLMAIPITSFMAAQVNYDDLLVLLTGISVWLAVKVARAIRQERRVPVVETSCLAAIALLASLIKYAYLPVLVALVVYFGLLVVRTFGSRPGQWLHAATPSWHTTKRWKLIVASLLLVVSIGLFVERYGINTVRYHSPTPECNQVLSLQRCMQYEPFARNYNYHQGHYPLPAHKIAAYPFNNWSRGMVRSLSFVVGNKQTGYPPGEPLILTHIAVWIVFVGGLVAVLSRVRWLWRSNPANQLFLTVTALYFGLLFLQNFMDFMHTHVAVAIQGRYLVPVLPLFLVLAVQTAGAWLRRIHTWAAPVFLLLMCVLFIEGGGVVPWIVRANDAWLWDAPAVQHVQHGLQDMLDPVMLKASS